MNASNEIKYVPFDQLYLDTENPRLPISLDRNEDTILSYIGENYSIEELMGSIGSNGFFSGEPLVVVEENDKMIVVEGNRRLTAVKLLNNPELLGLNSIMTLASESEFIPKELPVVIFDNRTEVLNYLGHRHITGVKPWSSFAKARYLKQLFLEALTPEIEKEAAVKLVARRIGSRGDYVVRILGALTICEVIEQNNYFDIVGVGEHNFPFSVFYTAFQKTEIREYVGYPDFYTGDLNSINIDQLANLTTWICKKGRGQSTVLVNPGNIPKLAAVLSNEIACKELEAGLSLDDAYKNTVSYSDNFTSVLLNVKRDVSKLNSLVADIPYDDELDGQIESIIRQVKIFRNSWRDKKEGGDDL